MRVLGLIAAALVLVAASAVAGTPENGAGLKWSLQVVPAPKGAPQDQVELVFTSDIAPGWIVYSSDFNAEMGPQPAKLTFKPNDAIEIVGPVEAVSSRRAKDRTWGTEYAYFAKRAEFRQKARLLRDATTLEGRINGQTCYEADGLCELFTESFSLSVKRP